MLCMAEEADNMTAFTNSMQCCSLRAGSARHGSATHGSICHRREHVQLLDYSCWTPKAFHSFQEVHMTRDSLTRMLLHVTSIQRALACALAQKLHEVVEAQGS